MRETCQDEVGIRQLMGHCQRCVHLTNKEVEVVAKKKLDKPAQLGWDEDLCTECKTRAERRERSCTKSHVSNKAFRGEERKMVLATWFSEFPMGGPRR